MTGGSHTGAGADPRDGDAGQAAQAAQASEATAPGPGAPDDVVAEQGPESAAAEAPTDAAAEDASATDTAATDTAATNPAATNPAATNAPSTDTSSATDTSSTNGASSEDAQGSPADVDELGEPTLEQRLAAAEALADEHWNGRLRLQADLENQRKRALRDVQNARKFGLEPLLNDLLPVVDSLQMGLQASRGENVTVESLREGTEITLNMFSTTLEKHGIAEVNPEGEKFDPEFHQAMSMQEVEGAAPNTVVQVLQKGYTLNERLLRPALVMVAK